MSSGWLQRLWTLMRYSRIANRHPFSWRADVAGSSRFDRSRAPDFSIFSHPSVATLRALVQWFPVEVTHQRSSKSYRKIALSVDQAWTNLSVTNEKIFIKQQIPFPSPHPIHVQISNDSQNIKRPTVIAHPRLRVPPWPVRTATPAAPPRRPRTAAPPAAAPRRCGGSRGWRGSAAAPPAPCRDWAEDQRATRPRPEKWAWHGFGMAEANPPPFLSFLSMLKILRSFPALPCFTH